MTRLVPLEQTIRARYEKRDPNRADWADWLYDNHVFVVADYAVSLADRYGASSELARAAAVLHDIADTEMKRAAANHAEESLRISRELMVQYGYSADEIALVVDDAIQHHSCRDGAEPASLEGKILATADSLAHLKTDFYIYSTWALGREKTLTEVKAWTMKKVEKDIQGKIFFPEVREELMPDYLRIKTLFAR